VLDYFHFLIQGTVSSFCAVHPCAIE